jgi:hypothetical protein
VSIAQSTPIDVGWDCAISSPPAGWIVCETTVHADSLGRAASRVIAVADHPSARQVHPGWNIAAALDQHADRM